MQNRTIAVSKGEKVLLIVNVVDDDVIYQLNGNYGTLEHPKNWSNASRGEHSNSMSIVCEWHLKKHISVSRYPFSI